MNWHVHPADNSSSFLNGEIDGELYLRWDNKCYKLHKSRYGLKQYPHLLHQKLKNDFKSLDSRSWSGARGFKFKDDRHELITLVYVDQLVILSHEISGV